MALAAKLSAWPELRQRRAERVPVDIDTRMRVLGSTGDDVHIHNLSTHGFMAEADDIYPVDSYVWLKLPGVGEVNARIVWRDCFRYGCEFVTPLAESQCQAAAALGQQNG
jgi:hypothetical protein